MFKKDLTLQECEKIEAEKREENRLATNEIEMLTTKNDDLLVDISFGDKTAEEEFSRNELRILDLKKKIRANNAFLEKALPVQKNRALALEIESLIPEIKKRDAQLPALVADVNKKAAALNEANDKLLELLDGFDELDATKSLGISRDFLELGLGDLNFRPSPGTASATGQSSVDIAVIAMAAIHDKDRFVGWVENARTSIAERLVRIRDHALRLRGEKLAKSGVPYCPNCYSYVSVPDKYGKSHCKGCGKTIEPVY